MKKDLVKLLLTTVVALVVGVGAGAQVMPLIVGTVRPVIDGTIVKGEYQISQELDLCTLYLSRTADTRYIGYLGDAQGWGAVGLGTLRMDGSTILIGSVIDGKSQFQMQFGGGHRHYDGVPKEVENTVRSYAIKQHAGSLIMEIALKANAYIKDGQRALSLIYATGDGASFSTMHVARGIFEVNLK